MHLIFLKNRQKLYFVLPLILLLFLFPLLVSAEANDIGVAEKLGGSWLEEALWSLINAVFGWLVWMSGNLLDDAVNTFVIGFGELFKTTGLGVAVDELWKTVRDIFNLTFIFGLVYIGFKIILNSEDSSAKKMLSYIIMAALLVNFSLFITKFIIDFSNIAASQVAMAFDDGTGNYQVAGKFMDRMGLSSIFDAKGGSLLNAANGSANGMTYIFGTLFIYIITTFAFLSGAILLLIRFAVLNLYMILSPIMFLGWVFPNLAKYSQQYWSNFLNRAFFAPAYILMLYFAYVVFNQFSGITQSGSIAKMFLNADDAKSQFLLLMPYFTIMIVFLIAAIVAGQKMGIEGGNAVVSIGRNISGRGRRMLQRGAGAVTFGLAAKGMQSSFGTVGRSIATNKKMSEWEAKNKWFVGAAAAGAARKLADSSFDARRIGGIGRELGIGEGKKGGLASRIAEKEKEDILKQKRFLQNETRDEKGRLTEPAAKAIEESLDKTIELAQKDTEQANAQIKLSEAALKKAEENDNKEEVAKLQKRISELKEDITNNDKRIEQVNQEKDSGQGELTKAAEADYRYANHQAFRNRREAEGKFWGGVGTPTSAGLLGGTAGLATASALGLAVAPVLAAGLATALASAGAAKAYGMKNASSAMNMARLAGKTGFEMDKNNKISKEIKILKEQLDKEDDKSGSGSTPKEETKPESKTDTK